MRGYDKILGKGKIISGRGRQVRFLNQRFLESAEFPFGCTWFEHPPGHITNKHSHEFIELVYVCRGGAIHHYNDTQYPVGKGDVFVIPKGVAHYYQVSDKQPRNLPRRSWDIRSK